MAKGLPIKIGTWRGNTNMMSVPLEYFQVILGMEFMHTTKLVPMSFLNSLCMMGGDDPCVVLVSRRETREPQQISTFN